MRALLPLAATLLAGCTAAATRADGDEREVAELLAGRTAGEAQRCIGTTTWQAPQIVGDTIAYRDGRRLWVSRAVDGCPSLSGDPLLIVEQYGSRLCANDRFRTVPRGSSIPGPYCRFGPFVPYSAPR